MDRQRMQELFPTFSRMARGVGRMGRAALRLSGRFARRAWRPALIVLVSFALLHTAAVIVTRRMVAGELAKVRALGYPTAYDEFVTRGSRASSSARAAHDACLRLFRAMADCPETRQYEERDKYALLSFDLPVSDSAWQSAREHADKFRDVAAQAAAIDWKRTVAAMRDQQRIATFSRRIEDLTGDLRADAVAEAHRGNIARATSLLMSAARIDVARSSLPVRDFWPELGSAMLTRRVVMRIAAITRLSEYELRLIADALPLWNVAQALRHGVAVYLLNTLEGYEMLRECGYPGAFADYCTNEERPFWDERATGYLQSPYLNANEIMALKDFRYQVALCSMPYRAFVAASGKADPWTSSATIPKWAFIARGILAVNIGYCARQRDETVALTEGNRLYLSVLAYKARLGQYPSRLSEVRRLGWASVPSDPFSGKDFVYKRQGNGFILYSIGPDLLDNGGKPVRHGSYWDDRDIVWYDPEGVRGIQKRWAEEQKKLGRGKPLLPMCPPPGM